MTEEVDPRRRLQIPGTYNVRDLGGYPIGDGRQTRWGQLLRADSLHRLNSAVALQPFRDYGLRAVLDLRKSSEVQELRDPFFGSEEVTYRHQNMTGDVPLRELSFVSDTGPVAEQKRRIYSIILDKRRNVVREILALIARAETLPALFHCSAGTDRTGMVAALVLGIAGVPREIIVEDYGISGRFLLARRLDEEPDAEEITWQEYERRVSPAEVMKGMLRDLDERFCGIEGYVRAIGVSEAEIEGIRTAMIE